MVALFAIPFILVLASAFLYVFADYNVLQQWFNIDNDMEWYEPAVYGSLLFFFIGTVIASIKLKAWIALTIVAIMMISVAVRLISALSYLIDY